MRRFVPAQGSYTKCRTAPAKTRSGRFVERFDHCSVLFGQTGGGLGCILSWCQRCADDRCKKRTLDRQMFGSCFDETLSSSDVDCLWNRHGIGSQLKDRPAQEREGRTCGRDRKDRRRVVEEGASGRYCHIYHTSSVHLPHQGTVTFQLLTQPCKPCLSIATRPNCQFTPLLDVETPSWPLLYLLALGGPALDHPEIP